MSSEAKLATGVLGQTPPVPPSSPAAAASPSGMATAPRGRGQRNWGVAMEAGAVRERQAQVVCQQ